MIDIQANGNFLLVIEEEKDSVSGWQRNNEGGMT
jgi:hypothetical protein